MTALREIYDKWADVIIMLSVMLELEEVIEKKQVTLNKIEIYFNVNLKIIAHKNEMEITDLQMKWIMT